MVIAPKLVRKCGDDGSGPGVGNDREDPRRDREFKLRIGWAVRPKLTGPRSGEVPKFVGGGAGDSPLWRSVAGSKKLKASGLSKL